MSDERKRAHMEIVQPVVTRMAANSFQLKGWAVVLVSGLFGLAAADVGRNLAFVAYLPTIAFRKLYDHVRVLDDDDIDYSMNTMPFDQAVAPAWRVALSKTLVWFYGPLLVTVVVVSIVVSR
jgi:hypothetical protein